MQPVPRSLPQEATGRHRGHQAHRALTECLCRVACETRLPSARRRFVHRAPLPSSRAPYRRAPLLSGCEPPATRRDDGSNKGDGNMWRGGRSTRRCRAGGGCCRAPAADVDRPCFVPPQGSRQGPWATWHARSALGGHPGAGSRRRVRVSLGSAASRCSPDERLQVGGSVISWTRQSARAAGIVAGQLFSLAVWSGQRRSTGGSRVASHGFGALRRIRLAHPTRDTTLHAQALTRLSLRPQPHQRGRAHSTAQPRRSPIEPSAWT